MSTGSSESVPTGEAGSDREAAAFGVGAPAQTAPAAASTSAEGAMAAAASLPVETADGGPTLELGAQTAAFVDTFERWARHKAIDAGASIPRLRLLYSVYCHGPRKMADLADELTVTPRNVTALVDGLEADGLVKRVPHATDRRVTMVELTCSSDRVASQFAAYQASVEGLFAGLDEADLTTFRRLIATLGDRMHADAAMWTSPEKDQHDD